MNDIGITSDGALAAAIVAARETGRASAATTEALARVGHLWLDISRELRAREELRVAPAPSAEYVAGMPAILDNDGDIWISQGDDRYFLKGSGSTCTEGEIQRNYGIRKKLHILDISDGPEVDKPNE